MFLKNIIKEDKSMQNEKRQELFAEKEWYREKIIKMVKEIDSEAHINMIYGFVKKLHESK